VHELAVKLAKESGRRLVFLYVADPGALPGRDKGLESAARAELAWLGEVLLRLAQERARLRGVEAEAVIRTGDLRDELIGYLRENGVSRLLLGAPRGVGRSMFHADAMRDFAERIEEESGVPAQIVQPDSEDGDSV
jgi:nucleotide-binding universal stress UspA family protein